MRAMQVLVLLAVFFLASCAATQDIAARGGSPMIDEPVAPFPYNSKFCT